MALTRLHLQLVMAGQGQKAGTRVFDASGQAIFPGVTFDYDVGPMLPLQGGEFLIGSALGFSSPRGVRSFDATGVGPLVEFETNAFGYYGPSDFARAGRHVHRHRLRADQSKLPGRVSTCDTSGSPLMVLARSCCQRQPALQRFAAGRATNLRSSKRLSLSLSGVALHLRDPVTRSMLDGLRQRGTVWRNYQCRNV